MRTSTRANDPRTRGFTLVELMVVLVVMALAATAVVLTFRPADKAREEAVMLAGRIAALRDEAVMRSRPTGIWVTPSGFTFEQYADREWQPLSGQRFDGRSAFRSGVTARGSRTGIRFDNLGLPSGPQVITLDDDNGRTATITVAANGAVEAR